jgi:putative redox protein
MGDLKSPELPAVMDYRFESGDLTLSGHLSEPEAAPGAPQGLVLCHGFPTRGRESPYSGHSFPELADRISDQLGWIVLTMNFRGCGRSQGNFSLLGWLEDIAAAVDHTRSLGATGVWLAGVGTGGSLAIVEGARNTRVKGVAALAAPADFEDWARHPRQLLLHARQVQVVKESAFPPQFDEWAAELRSISPEVAAARFAPKPLLVLHGDKDDITPVEDGERLAAEHGSAEYRLLQGAGHELRHDPRAIAILLGWLRRQWTVPDPPFDADPMPKVAK